MAAQRDPYESPAIRAFASEQEAWRTQADISKSDLAERLGYTPQYVGQIESAKNVPSKKYAEDLDTFFHTNGVFFRLWKVVNDTRHLAVLPPGFPDFVEREAEASTMYVFEMNVVTGLFQTPEYAREILREGRPEEELEVLVAKRMDRQKILARKRPPRIVAIFDEGAIRRVIGGREVMQGQCQRLIELASQHNVTLHVVPEIVGAHAGLPGAFTILGFDHEPDLLYTEGHIDGQLTEHRSTVQAYRLQWDLIRGAAISADETLRLVHAALESL